MTDKYAKPINDIDRYAVVGNPISHSKSPLIHRAFAKQTGQDISYEAVLAPLDGFAATIQDLVNQGFKGANVTVPFKFEAFNLCDELTERAKSAGAANTLTFESGKIKGDNTDGVGLVNDIKINLKHVLQPQDRRGLPQFAKPLKWQAKCEGSSPQNIPAKAGYSCLKDAQILLLGAGGAAQGVLFPLLNAHPKSIIIANRTLAKAQQMAEKAGVAAKVSANTFESLQGKFDVIINATSTGLSDSKLPISDAIFAKNCLAYDMMYGRETAFMQQAKANGAQVADGLGMLVEQAAEAFFLWRGVHPQTAPVIKMLRS